MPPRGVKKGTKRARQYEHVKNSQKDQGTTRPRSSSMSKQQLQRAVEARKS